VNKEITIEIAEVTEDIKVLKKGDIVVVLNRYDVSSMAPISDDLCHVYFNGKLYTGILSRYLNVISKDTFNQTKKQDKLLELYKELSNQKSNLYSYDEQYRQYSYNRDVQVIVRYIETQIKELER